MAWFFDVHNGTLPELKGGNTNPPGSLGHATSIEPAMQNNEDLMLAYAGLFGNKDISRDFY